MRNYKLTTFIDNFDLANPIWDILPTGFPNCDKSHLTISQCCIYEAILLAWLNSQAGRQYLTKKATKIGASLAIFIVSLVSLINLISRSSQGGFARPVNAATISASLKSTSLKTAHQAGEVFESTMSAVFKKN